MYCLDYELTDCGVKLCCHDCNNKQRNKKCKLGKKECDYLCFSEPILNDEEYTED